MRGWNVKDFTKSSAITLFDLDYRVKVNCEKVQTVDGKKYSVLAKI